MSLSEKQGRKRMEYLPDYVVFDLETTGISTARDQIIEIAAIKVVGGKVTEEYSTLVNPFCHIPESASFVNGITDDMVCDAPSLDNAIKGFLDIAGDMVLVGHNIHSFDMKFLYRDMPGYFGRTLGNDYIDTLPLARAYLPQLSHHTLSDLANYYGIDAQGAHRALADCRMNQQVFERLGLEIQNPSEEARRVPRCPRCGNVMAKKNGRYGEFWGCTGYPDCKYTRNC
ncbi:MAG: topoisomerase DNA-binding C4 zinc finger domain-containing protein [Lachnospiraceae bacterium]|nr:topoisomerase DNA-binding C4 zinc finger domain-containing protein [Lachnospiraceae bacterium]